MKTVYPATPEILEWLNHTLTPIEASVFRHYRGIKTLVRIVDRAEAGLVPRYAALAAIREHNEVNATSITYDEVSTRSSTYIFAEIGEWAAYVDSPEVTNSVVTGPYDSPTEALEHADSSWSVLWLPSSDAIVVLRSPHFSYLGPYDTEEFADGLARGFLEAPTLPPELVASLGTIEAEEMMGA